MDSDRCWHVDGEWMDTAKLTKDVVEETLDAVSHCLYDVTLAVDLDI